MGWLLSGWPVLRAYDLSETALAKDCNLSVNGRKYLETSKPKKEEEKLRRVKLIYTFRVTCQISVHVT
jgi:hypothetical protein